MNSKTINKEIISLALPSMLALMSEPLMGIFDTMLIGNYGTLELAATAGISAILSMSLWLFNFLSTGTTSRIAIFFGAKKYSSIGSYLVRVLFIAFLISFFLVLFFLFFDKTLISLYGFGEDVQPLAIQYLKIRLLGLPFTLLLYTGIGFYRGIQNAVVPMISSLCANAVNLVLDILLIYGVKGFLPEMGIQGAAWATVIAQLIGLFILLVDSYRKEFSKMFSFSWKSTSKDYSKIFQTSGHLFFRTFFLLAGFLIASSVAARIGNITLAAHEISMKLWLLGSFTIDSFAVAGQALVGKYKGGKKEDETFAILLRYVMGWGLIFGILFALIYGFFGTTLIRLFTKDAAVIQTVSIILYLLIAMQPVSAITFVLDGILIGLEETRYLMQMMIIGSLLFISISIITLINDYGILGIWSGLTLLIIWRFFTNLKPFVGVIFKKSRYELG